MENKLKFGAAPLSAASQKMVCQAADKNPFLTREEEQALFAAWHQHKDINARNKIVLSYMPMALRMAREQSGYKMDMDDILGAAQIGLIKGMDTFDPNRGTRFSTCAYWTIKNEMNNHIVHNVSLLRGANTAASKVLFFNLKRIKSKLNLNRVVTLDDAKLVRQELAVKNDSLLGIDLNAIVEADAFMSLSTVSFDSPIGGSTNDSDSSNFSELLADTSVAVDENIAETQIKVLHKKFLDEAVSKLKNAREKHIFLSRRMVEPPLSLEDLSKIYNISRERVRQIEVVAFEIVSREVKRLLKKTQDVADGKIYRWRAKEARKHRFIEVALPSPLSMKLEIKSRNDGIINVSSIKATESKMVFAGAENIDHMHSNATRRGSATRGISMTAAQMRSDATRRGNVTRGAEQRRLISLKAAATVRARRMIETSSAISN